MLKHSKSVTMFFCNTLREQIFAGGGGYSCPELIFAIDDPKLCIFRGIDFRDLLHTHEIHAKISSLRYTYLALPDKKIYYHTLKQHYR